MKKNKKEELFQITCNKDQLNTIIKALDDYSRMYHGQLDMVITDLYRNITISEGKTLRNFEQDYNILKHAISILKWLIFKLPFDCGIGIGEKEKVPDSARSAYEMYRTMENCRDKMADIRGDKLSVLKYSNDTNFIGVEQIQ